MREEMPEGFEDSDLRAFCAEIVECLIEYGGLTPTDAEIRLEESRICSDEANQTPMDRMPLFHELPYEWAMSIIYGKENPNWANDPTLGLWPPPSYLARFQTEPIEPWIEGETSVK